MSIIVRLSSKDDNSVLRQKPLNKNTYIEIKIVVHFVQCRFARNPKTPKNPKMIFDKCVVRLNCNAKTWSHSNDISNKTFASCSANACFCLGLSWLKARYQSLNATVIACGVSLKRQDMGFMAIATNLITIESLQALPLDKADRLSSFYLWTKRP